MPFPGERDQSVATILDAYALHSDEPRAAVHRAYQAIRAHHARFITAVTADILDDLRADVAGRSPGRTVVFLGRDGHSFAAAARGLDARFVEQHCAEVVLSRAVADAALQDLERNTARRFDHLAEFRNARSRVDPRHVDGAHRMLTRYLRGAGIPVGKPGSAVTLVDSSFKGTVQELLAATYPQTSFTGRYAFHAASAGDPHPGTKRGYVFHQAAGARWRGVPETNLPAEAGLTFGCGDAISVIEDVLNGPASSPIVLTAMGPTQQQLRDTPHPLRGLNPALVRPSYRNPAVREAVKVVALQAVYDEARAVADTGAASSPAGRVREIEAFAEQVRAWIQRSPSVDPQLADVLDSFVLRADRALMGDVQDVLQRAGVSEREAVAVWERLAEVQTVQGRRTVAADLIRKLPGSARHPARAAVEALSPAQGPAHPRPAAGGSARIMRRVAEPTNDVSQSRRRY